MTKEIKKSYKIYAAWNYEKEEQHINDMAKAGWQLIKGGCFNTIYQKDEDKQYVYKIDYNPDTIKNSVEKKRYLQMFEEMGWEHINSTFNGWNYFKKKYDESNDSSEYEIYTDKTSYKEMLLKWCKLGKIILVIEFLSAILYTFISIIEKNLIIGIEALVFWAIFFWIKNGLQIMNKKIDD